MISYFIEKKTIVFDLDMTLIYATESMPQTYDCKAKFYINQKVVVKLTLSLDNYYRFTMCSIDQNLKKY